MYLFGVGAVGIEGVQEDLPQPQPLQSHISHTQ